MDYKIKQLDKQNIQMLRDAVQKSLDKVGDMYGLTIKLGNIRYDNLSFRSKVEAYVDEPASGVGYEQEAFNSTCFMYGLKPEDYLKEVTLNGQKFWGTKAKIYGFNPRSRKYPVLVRTDSGQLIKSGRNILSQIK
jgi:hypothetical protein